MGREDRVARAEVEEWEAVGVSEARDTDSFEHAVASELVAYCTESENESDAAAVTARAKRTNVGVGGSNAVALIHAGSSNGGGRV